MHAQAFAAIALVLVSGLAHASADDIVWRRAGDPTPVRPAGVKLGRPAPLDAGCDDAVQPVSLVTRAQAGDPLTGGMPPPPPPPPYPGAPPAALPQAGANPFDCGQPNSNPDQGFFPKLGRRLRNYWDDATGGVNTAVQGVSQTAFKSDHAFDSFASPVSNPFYFEDPRALTELRPVFIWQRTPGSNPVFAGGSNFFLDLQARVALTPWLSFVIDELGYTWTGIDNPASGFQSHSGFSEIHLGPKVTFLRNETSNTVMAGGVTFAIPAGPTKVFQDTGSVSVIPYYSVAQSFLRSQYGEFNFMNTDGYSFGDAQRTDFFFASFHLDYNVGRLNKFYPLVELNWTHYTANGKARPFSFEGSNLFNFGSTSVAGSNDLTVALGMRYLVNQNLQFGIVPEFNVLGNSGTGRHLDNFRLTVDMIYRY